MNTNIGFAEKVIDAIKDLLVSEQSNNGTHDKFTAEIAVLAASIVKQIKDLQIRLENDTRISQYAVSRE